MISGSKLEETMSIMYKVVEKIFDQIRCGLGPLSSSLDGEISRKRNLAGPQLPGRVFSPSDIWKKLSQPLLLHFPFGMGTYVHHTKY